MPFWKKFMTGGLVVLLTGVLSISSVYADDDDDDGWSWFGSKSEKHDEHDDDDDDDDDDHHEYDKKKARRAAANPVWKQECSECHLAFPARYLPAESWREMMSSLDKHFGSNASLDPETANEITTYLEQNARTRRSYRDSSGKYPLRITETRWFRHEHDEVASEVRNNPKVKSLANCAVCHKQAELGDYNEHNVTIPR